MWINGQKYEDLPEWEWDQEGIYRSSIENNWKGKVKRTEYKILDGDEEVPVKIRHDEAKNITKVQVEDREEIIRGKSMNDKSLFPLRIAHENRDWTLEIDVD